MVAAAIGVGAVGAVAGAGSALIGSSQQQQSNQQAIDAQKQFFQKIQQNLSPYMTAGGPAVGALQRLTGVEPGGNPLTAPLTQPFTPTMASLAQTPGYQFQLNQGLQGVQNSYAAQGLSSSGAALKGAANYAEGLAGTTYQNQFADYLSQQGQIYNMLQGQIGTGLNAAGGFANAANISGGNIGNALIGQGNAAAAGTVGAGNAISGGLGSGLSAYFQQQYLNSLTGGGGGGGGVA